MIHQARTQLDLAMQAQLEQSDVAEAHPVSAPAPALAGSSKVPLPRSRPPEAQLLASASRNDGAPSGTEASGSAPDIRSLLQKIAALLPSGFKLASAAPDGGVFGNGQDLPPRLAG